MVAQQSRHAERSEASRLRSFSLFGAQDDEAANPVA
jgi:hypothetical protein